MEVSVRQCSDEEALDILCDPTVVKLLSVEPKGIGLDWFTLLMDERLLVVAKAEGDSVEIHVACRYRDRATARDTMINGLKWFTDKGFKTIWTTAPDERKALVKMLESLQFRKVGERWIYGY